MGQNFTISTNSQPPPTIPKDTRNRTTQPIQQDYPPYQTAPPIRQDYLPYQTTPTIRQDYLPNHTTPSIVRKDPPVVRKHPPIVRKHPPVVRKHPSVVRKHPSAVRKYPPVVRKHPSVARLLPPVVRKHPPTLTTPRTMCEIRKFHHKTCGQFISRVFAHSPDCQRTACNWTEIDLQVDRICPWCDNSLSGTFTDTHSRLGEISGGDLAGTCEMKMLRHHCCGSSYECSVTHKTSCSQEECIWVFLDEIVDVICEDCKEMSEILTHFGADDK